MKDNQFMFIQELFPHFTIAERKQYAWDLGDQWTDIINQPYTYLDERDYNLYSIVEYDNQKWLGEPLRYCNLSNNLVMEDKGNCYYTWEGAVRASPKGFKLPSLMDIKTITSSSNHLRIDIGYFTSRYAKMRYESHTSWFWGIENTTENACIFSSNNYISDPTIWHDKKKYMFPVFYILK